MKRILLVDDDRFLLASLRRLLAAEGYDVDAASSAEEGLQKISGSVPDLAVLDVSLPDYDGMTLCRKIRGKWKFPILMLTARSDATSKVMGLEIGADDYLTKPFEPQELVARVRAMLRRSTEYSLGEAAEETITIGDLTIDFAAHQVSMGAPLKLTQKEFELLAHLARNVGRVVTRSSLFERNWGYDLSFDTNSLDVHIYRLRKKIERDPASPRYLHTVKGYGYKLECVDSTSPIASAPE